VLAIKTTEYVLAARAIGASTARIMLRHILPNSFTPLLVMATLLAGTVVVEIAGLSFLGLGASGAMYISCLVTDYDGTLAHQGVVDEATTNALIALRRRQPERGSASAPRHRGTHNRLRAL
jgi:ABC-type microcin C transport system permease subunit YejB